MAVQRCVAKIVGYASVASLMYLRDLSLSQASISIE